MHEVATKPSAPAPLPFSRILLDAVLVVVAASLVGFAVNALRPSGSIPFIQTKPYDIVVPCPEPVGDAQPMAPDDRRLLERSTLIIDAQAKTDFDVYHLPQAINIPFDWLGPPVEKEVKEVAQRIARSKAWLVVVVGDGDDPDSGREWARLLAGGGLKNVYYVTGGAVALRARLHPPQGATP